MYAADKTRLVVGIGERLYTGDGRQRSIGKATRAIHIARRYDRRGDEFVQALDAGRTPFGRQRLAVRLRGECIEQRAIGAEAQRMDLDLAVGVAGSAVTVVAVRAVLRGHVHQGDRR